MRESTVCEPVSEQKPFERLRASFPAPAVAALMPPKSSKRKAAPGNDSAEAAAQDTQKGLNKSVVEEFVLTTMLRNDRLGEDFLNDDEKQQWRQWLASEPSSAAEVAAEDWPLPVEMPRKCLPRPAGGGGEASTSAGQQEIVAYSNASGRQFSTSARARQYQQTRRLAALDVKVGSTVALKRSEESIQQPGYGTPFYLGDVVELREAPDGGVQSLRVHYRMPVGAGQLFCNDLKKPWRLACHALHVHDGKCKHSVACRQAASKAGSSDTRFTYTAEPEEVLETGIAFNLSNTLKVESKRRLAQSATDKGGWDEMLGL